MQLALDTPRLALEPGQVVTLDDACGAFIEPTGGRVWVTLEGERRDFVLQPGETMQVCRAGRTVVQAVERAGLTLHEGVPCPLPTDRRGVARARRARAWVSGLREAATRHFDAVLAAVGHWLDGPSRTPCADPGASRRHS